MKRLYSELSPLSDETEPVIKRPRLLISSLSSTFEIDEAEEEIINDESINSIDRLEINYSIEDDFTFLFF